LIRIAPRHVTALNNLGAALFKLGHPKNAEAYFYQAIKIEPDFPDAHSNIGNALLLKGQYAAAEQFLRRALKLNPHLLTLWMPVSTSDWSFLSWAACAMPGRSLKKR
jgi:Flp pilus assembly protein TadD